MGRSSHFGRGAVRTQRFRPLRGESVKPFSTPPQFPPTTPVSRMYGSLWPSHVSSTVAPTPVYRAASSSNLATEPPVATSHLVASELVLLALTGLMLHGWDRDSSMPEEEKKRFYEAWKEAKTMRNNDFVAKQEQLSRGDFVDMGRICRKTAKVAVSQGAPTEPREKSCAHLRGGPSRGSKPHDARDRARAC